MTKSFAAILMLGSAALLSACSSSTLSFGGGVIRPGTVTDSALVTPNPDGTITDPRLTTAPGGNGGVLETSNGRTSGFSYQHGRVRGTNTYLGVAGIAPDTDPGAAPTAAQATYSGRYQLAHVSETIDAQDGNITLAADFNAGTLQGSSGGLVVDGTITGQDVGGRASYGGVDANMTGVIGQTRAVTAFAGHTDRAVLVGGIFATPQ